MHPHTRPPPVSTTDPTHNLKPPHLEEVFDGGVARRAVGQVGGEDEAHDEDEPPDPGAVEDLAEARDGGHHQRELGDGQQVQGELQLGCGGLGSCVWVMDGMRVDQSVSAGVGERNQ